MDKTGIFLFAFIIVAIGGVLLYFIDKPKGDK